MLRFPMFWVGISAWQRTWPAKQSRPMKFHPGVKKSDILISIFNRTRLCVVFVSKRNYSLIATVG